MARAAQCPSRLNKNIDNPSAQAYCRKMTTMPPCSENWAYQRQFRKQTSVATSVEELLLLAGHYLSYCTIHCIIVLNDLKKKKEEREREKKEKRKKRRKKRRNKEEKKSVPSIKGQSCTLNCPIQIHSIFSQKSKIFV